MSRKFEGLIPLNSPKVATWASSRGQRQGQRPCFRSWQSVLRLAAHPNQWWWTRSANHTTLNLVMRRPSSTTGRLNMCWTSSATRWIVGIRTSQFRAWSFPNPTRRNEMVQIATKYRLFEPASSGSVSKGLNLDQTMEILPRLFVLFSLISGGRGFTRFSESRGLTPLDGHLVRGVHHWPTLNL